MNMSQLIKWVKDILRDENTLFRYVNNLKEAGTYQIVLDDGSSKSIYLINESGRLKVMLQQVKITEVGNVKVQCEMFYIGITLNSVIEGYIRAFTDGTFYPKYTMTVI